MLDEFAPYIGDTKWYGTHSYENPRIWAKVKIKAPVFRHGAYWVSTGSALSELTKKQNWETGYDVYRVISLRDYRSPHPDLPLFYPEHVALPDDHPFRFGYEGIKCIANDRPVVLCDHHVVMGRPSVLNLECTCGCAEILKKHNVTTLAEADECWRKINKDKHNRILHYRKPDPLWDPVIQIPIRDNDIYTQKDFSMNIAIQDKLL